jgi:hypothetical protein
MRPWRLDYMLSLERYYLAEAEGVPDGSGARSEDALFDVVRSLVHLGSLLGGPGPSASEMARATASVNIALARVVFADSGVDPDTAVELLADLQEQHLGDWHQGDVDREAAVEPAHDLLGAIRFLVGLEEALAAEPPVPSEVEASAAALANRVLAIAHKTGVFEPPGTRSSGDARAAAG